VRACFIVVKADLSATPILSAAKMRMIVVETGNEPATCKKLGLAMSARHGEFATLDAFGLRPGGE
jgi:hypothetical protein